MLDGFRSREETESKRDIERVIGVFNRFLDNIKNTNIDWGAWDEALSFVEGQNPDFISANLVNETYLRLGLSVIVYTNAEASIVYSGGFNQDDGIPTQVPQGLRPLLAPGQPLVSHTGLKSGIAGLLSLPEGPMLITSHPVLTSTEMGPIRGAVIFGRFVDKGVVASLKETTLFNVEARNAKNPSLPGDFRKAIEQADEKGLYTKKVSSDTIGGYAVINDISGAPGLILRADIPRGALAQGNTTVLFVIIALIASLFVFGFVVLVLLDRLVLSRVERLSNGLREIAVSGSPSSRVTVPGSDEITSVGTAINDMLAAIERSQAERAQAQEALLESEAVNRAILVAVPDVLFRANREGRTLAFAGARQFESRLPNTRIVEKAGSDVIPPEYVADHVRNIQMTLDTGSSRIMEYQSLDNNQIHWFEARYVVCQRDEGLVMVRDITERKLAQEREDAARLKFLRVLSHELRTPLTPVAASAGLLEDVLEPEPDSQEGKLLSNIKSGADVLRRRIDDMLDVAAFQARTLPLDLAEIDTKVLLTELCDLRDAEAKRRGESTQLEIRDPLPKVTGDGPRLRQVVSTLLLNAIRANPPQASTYPSKPSGTTPLSPSASATTERRSLRRARPSSLSPIS
ncbi:MAG: HAMP domain-containing protein [Chloroflexi bacterium]|nr:HAMP domain-containing protein [Chloroflexota bacterium]